MKLPAISEAKLKEGIFVDPLIREVFKFYTFEDELNLVELPAWKAFKDVIKGFSGNERSSNYVERVNILLQTYKSMRCNMFPKIHFLHSDFDSIDLYF